MHDHLHPSASVVRGEESAVERAFALTIGLNVVYVLAEAFYGIRADSVALLADAAHNLGDILGLLLAWGATWLARREPEGRHTYGWQKSTILAALANALLLIGVTGGLVWEAVERLFEPPAPGGLTMMIVAGVGVLINGLSALVLLRSGHAHHHHHGAHAHHEHGEEDVNLRGAFLHMAADAGVSVGVVVTGALLMWSGRPWLDPLASVLIALVIFASTWSLLREALDLALDAAPKHIDVERVRELLQTQPGVLEVHDLHVWAMSSRDVALTAHLSVSPDAPAELLREANEALGHAFGIAHVTLQLESAAHGAGACSGC